MLRFTDAQQAALLAVRAGFNQRQTAMAANSAADMQLAGNSAPVPLDAWRRIDTRGVTIQRDVLAVFNRLAAANTIPVGVGDLVNYYPQVSDSGAVSVSLDGRHIGNDDQAQVKYAGTPVPVIDSTARFGWRQMEVLRKGGMIDTETLANNQRKVAEKAEDLVLNGDASIVVGGATVYGLRNHPSRNTTTHGFDLNGGTATGANWLAAVSKVISLCIADNAYGKVTVFMNYADWVYASINEFVAGYPKTILQRLREIEQIADIVPASKVPADDLIGIAGIENGNWGGILSAMPMVTRPKFRANPEDDYVFSVMMMAAPQFRTDFNGQMPVAHVTAS